jgi:hypothetical protein
MNRFGNVRKIFVVYSEHQMKPANFLYVSKVLFTVHYGSVFIAATLSGERTEHYEGLYKIFRTDVKIIQLIIRPIGRHHPRSISLPHVDTGPTVSSLLGKLPGSPFLSRVSSTLCDSAWISSLVLNRRPFSFNFIFGDRRKSQGAKSEDYGGGWVTDILYFTRNCWVGMKM